MSNQQQTEQPQARVIATPELMALEIREIIRDIAAGDEQQANALHGPYTDIFDHLRNYLLKDPRITLPDPERFIQAIDQAEDLRATTRIVTRTIVATYFRERQEWAGHSGRGWWQRLIDVVDDY